MQPCLVISHRIHTEVLEMLSHSFRVVPNMASEPLSREELLRRSLEADALIISGSDLIDRSFVKACPRLKIIAAVLEGSGNADVQACTESGVWFTSNGSETLSGPHIGSATDEARRLRILDAAACVFEALSGQKPKGAINHPSKRKFISTTAQL